MRTQIEYFAGCTGVLVSFYGAADFMYGREGYAEISAAFLESGTADYHIHIKRALLAFAATPLMMGMYVAANAFSAPTGEKKSGYLLSSRRFPALPYMIAGFFVLIIWAVSFFIVEEFIKQVYRARADEAAQITIAFSAIAAMCFLNALIGALVTTLTQYLTIPADKGMSKLKLYLFNAFGLWLAMLCYFTLCYLILTENAGSGFVAYYTGPIIFPAVHLGVTFLFMAPYTKNVWR